MPESNGHITAPVGLATVAKVLGESRTDTDTLCRSAKINPHSLIRPLFRATDTPGTPPSWFSQTENYGSNLALIVPKGKLGEVQNPIQIKGSGLKCDSEYDFGTGLYIYHALMRWGYIVPYVTQPSAILALRDCVWKRYGPADDAVPQGRSEDQQFDGYLHNALPVDPMTHVQLEYGKKIAYTPLAVKGNTTVNEILGTTNGKVNETGHPGGVVSIPAVLGVKASYVYGMTVFHRTSENEKYQVLRHFLGQTVSSSAGEFPILGSLGMNSGSAILAGKGDYVVIPWVVDKDNIVELSADGKIMSITGNARFYGFRFSERFDGYAEKTITPRVLSLLSVNIPGVTPKVIDMSYDKGTGKTTVSFTLYNPWGNYALTAQEFYLQFRYRDAEGTIQERGFGFKNNDYAQTGTNLSINNTALVPTVNGTVISNGMVVVTHEGNLLVGTHVTLNVTLPAGLEGGELGVTNAGNKGPVFSKLAFTSVDKNPEGGNLAFPVIHTSTSGLANIGSASGNTILK